jgi:hypothetical protein
MAEDEITKRAELARKLRAALDKVEAGDASNEQVVSLLAAVDAFDEFPAILMAASSRRLTMGDVAFYYNMSKSAAYRLAEKIGEHDGSRVFIREDQIEKHLPGRKRKKAVEQSRRTK